MKFIITLLIVFFCLSVSSYADDISTTTENGREYIDKKPEGDISKQNRTDEQNDKKGSNPLINVKKGADNFTMLESEIRMGESGRTALETQAKNTKIERTKITTKGASGKDNSETKAVIDIANTTIQSEISALKKSYKDDLNILYEDMSRKGQLNGTPMLDRLSKHCLNEIEDCVQLIHNTLLRVVKDSGVSYSDELAAELKYAAKRHLTEKIGNINGYIKQKNNLSPTLEAQLTIRETELNNKRSNELKKLNSEIDLLVISLKNQEKQLKRPDSPNSPWLSSTFNISKIIWWVLYILGAIIAGLIIHHYTKSPDKKQINLKPISNKGVISQTTIHSDVKGDKVFGDKNVYQGQKPDTSLVSNFQEALSLMPELLMDMAKDLKDAKAKLIREFYVLPNRQVFLGKLSKPMFVYYEDDYDNLQNKLDILEDYGFITDARVGNTPIYRMIPELVQFLRTDIEIT